MRDPGNLPHAYPFRFLETSSTGLEVRFSWTAAGSLSRGGRVPPWVLLEVMIQGAGVLLGQGEPPGGVAVQVRGFRAPRPVSPSDRIGLRAALVKRMGPVFLARVTARREGRLIASGLVTIRENPS